MKSPPYSGDRGGHGALSDLFHPHHVHDPLTGTAAFSPLGYMQIQGTREYRRVYP